MPLGRAVGKRSFIARSNLVSALIRAIDHPSAANSLFLVSDGEDISSADLVRCMATALGVPAHLWSIPEGILCAMLALIGKGADAARLFEPLQIDSSRVRARMQWAPPVNVAQAMQEAVTNAP